MMPMLEDLARRKAGIIKVGMVNTEQAVMLARRFEVMSVPRLALYRNGSVLDELNGAVSRSQLEEWIAHVLRR
jgi:thioredoxin 2